MSRRLTLVIHSLEGGGAERTLSAMANHWSAGGDRITFITLGSADNDVFPLHDSVQRVELDGLQESSNLVSALLNNRRRVRRLRAAIRDSRPDCVIAFTLPINVLTQFAARRLGIPTILSERIDPRGHPANRIWRWLQRRTYRHCEALVVQTEHTAQYFAPFVPEDRIHVIPNGVGAGGSESGARSRRIVAMGRLDRQKGFDLLIAAFAQVAPQHPDWSLVIHGEGPSREALESQVRELGLGSRVSLPGWTNDPREAFRSGGLFALSSRSEGFPNALLEAMAQGIPAISFDCDSGPREIIKHDVNGLLAPAGDTKQFAKFLDDLMASEDDRRRLGEQARKVAEDFSFARFYERWDSLIASVTS